MNKLKILIVDDSIIFRTAFKKLFDCEDMEVVGSASNGQQAVEQNLSLKPDVITMDVEMPILNGLEATRLIMQTAPTKIILVSSLTTNDSETTVRGLSYGALDFVHKVNRFGSQTEISALIVDKVRSLGNLKAQLTRNRTIKEKYELTKQRANAANISGKIQHISDMSVPQPDDLSLITIGISTGGPNTLAEIVPRLSSRIRVPIVVVQHMPANFTKSLADRLHKKSELVCVEAVDGVRLQAGHLYICPGGKQSRIKRGRLFVSNADSSEEIYSPSYNELLESIIKSSESVMAIMMTGMGSDGTRALKRFRENGGYVVAQSPETCVISGMPKSAIAAGEVDAIYDLERIPELLNSIV